MRGLPTRQQAHRIAKVVAEAALVKTAIAGNDANWGRIASAAGYAGIEIEEDEISVRINGTLMFQHGEPIECDRAALAEQLRADRQVHIELDFSRGDASVRFWTCDLTQEYVRLNSELET